MGLVGKAEKGAKNGNFRNKEKDEKKRVKNQGKVVGLEKWRSLC